MRQLYAGITSTVSRGRLTEALMLFDGLVEVFIDFCNDTDGAIRRQDSMLQVLIDAFNTLIDAGG